MIQFYKIFSPDPGPASLAGLTSDQAGEIRADGAGELRGALDQAPAGLTIITRVTTLNTDPAFRARRLGTSWSGQPSSQAEARTLGNWCCKYPMTTWPIIEIIVVICNGFQSSFLALLDPWSSIISIFHLFEHKPFPPESQDKNWHFRLMYKW